MAMKRYIVDGISLNIDSKILESYRLLEITGEIQDETTPDEKKPMLTRRLIRLVLGKDYDKAINELEERNGGFLTQEQVGKFFEHVTKEIMPKN